MEQNNWKGNNLVHYRGHHCSEFHGERRKQTLPDNAEPTSQPASRLAQQQDVEQLLTRLLDRHEWVFRIRQLQLAAILTVPTRVTDEQPVATAPTRFSRGHINREQRLS